MARVIVTVPWKRPRWNEEMDQTLLLAVGKCASEEEAWLAASQKLGVPIDDCLRRFHVLNTSQVQPEGPPSTGGKPIQPSVAEPSASRGEPVVAAQAAEEGGGAATPERGTAAEAKDTPKSVASTTSGGTGTEDEEEEEETQMQSPQLPPTPPLDDWSEDEAEDEEGLPTLQSLTATLNSLKASTMDGEEDEDEQDL